MFYAASTNSFYDKEIHEDNIPADAVEISAEQHARLMRDQESGLQISANGNGTPVSLPPPPPTPEQMQAAKNAAARKYLAETDWYVIRHAETGQPIPSDVAEKRAEARASVVE